MRKIFLGTNIFSDPIFFYPKFFWPKMNFNENDLWRDKTKLSKLPSAKVFLKLEFDTKIQVLLWKYLGEGGMGGFKPWDLVKWGRKPEDLVEMDILSDTYNENFVF